jgi:hypothetical protein
VMLRNRAEIIENLEKHLVDTLSVFHRMKVLSKINHALALSEILHIKTTTNKFTKYNSKNINKITELTP